METFTAYLIKSVIWLTGFALVYFLFLQNERFFLLKRFYLIAGLVFSFVFPLVTIHYKIDIPASEGIHPGMMAILSGQGTVVQNSDSGGSIGFKHIMLFLYLSGILLLTLKMVRQLFILINILNKSVRVRVDGANVIKAAGLPGSFSFFNYVFINPSLNEAESKIILNHELVHVNQHHWIDLLLVELIRIFQWINPFAWIYSRFIRQNHEFIADNVALEHLPDPALYKAVLINQLLNTRIFSLSDSFNYSLNKKRFDMMKKTVFSPYRKMKVFIIIPVLTFVFYAFAKPEYNRTALSDFGPNNDRSALSAVIQDQGAGEMIGTDDSSGSQEQPQNSVLTNAETVKIAADQTIQNSVKGVILSTYEKPVAGVTVTSVGSGSNVAVITTGSDGLFELENVPGDARLLFTCPGYKRLALEPDFKKEMTVHLEIDPDYVPPSTQVNRRPEPLVVIDGNITDKTLTEARKDLGYDFGTMKMLTGKDASDKYGEKGTNGVVEILTRKKALEMGLNPPYPRLSPDDFPTFQGQKYTGFNDWIISHASYPREARDKNIEGLVQASVTVGTDGSISDVKPAGTVSTILSEEVKKVIRSAPGWDPPKNQAVKEPFTFSIMVNFQLPDQVNYDIPFVVVEEMPQYPGGEKALLDFLKENTNYPESAKADKIEGRVIVRFIVNKSGNVEGLSVMKGVDPALDAEALRVVGMLSGFKPGMQGGKPVPVWYMVPVNFSLSSEEQ
jgi:TonB family protein